MASSRFTANPGTSALPVFTFTVTPTVPTDVFIRAQDTDSASSLRAVAANSVEGGLKEVSGRIKFGNAYGSERLPLIIGTTLQYFNGNNWVRISNDSVTTFNTNLTTAGGNILATIINGLGSGVSVNAPGVTAFTNGYASFTLNSPGTPGTVDLSIPGLSGVGCDEIVPTPLGCFLPGERGRVTFGIYKNNNNFIYRRER
jgi:MSHA biogenesis protein MshQ